MMKEQLSTLAAIAMMGAMDTTSGPKKNISAGIRMPLKKWKKKKSKTRIQKQSRKANY